MVVVRTVLHGNLIKGLHTCWTVLNVPERKQFPKSDPNVGKMSQPEKSKIIQAPKSIEKKHNNREHNQFSQQLHSVGGIDL
jgi:hypothetical protein